MAPRISVVLPVKNGERFLAEALASVGAQELPPDEILVVDGQSTDRSRDIARAHPGVRVIDQTDGNLYDAFNIGIRAAAGDLIAFIESDDRWSVDKLQRQAARLAADSALEVVVARVRFFLAEGCEVPAGFRRELLERDVVARIPGTTLVRRAVFDRIGLFDTGLQIAADVDWFARCNDARVATGVDDAVLLYKRIHDRNVSSDARRNTRELLSLLGRSIRRRRDTPA